MNRLFAVLLLVTASCGPYSYLRKADENPMDGQTVLMLGSLLYSNAEIDGLHEDIWIAGQNDTWKAEWPGDQGRSAAGFATTLKSRLQARGITMTPQANPQGATLMVKPWVTRLETGGWNPTILVVSAQLCDANGGVLEEIQTKVKVKSNFNKFEDRLDQAALLAAENVAQWVTERSAK